MTIYKSTVAIADSHVQGECNRRTALENGQQNHLQSTFVISTSFIPNNRLTRNENLIPVLTWKSNTTGNKILWKRSNFSSFPQYFQYIIKLHIHL